MNKSLLHALTLCETDVNSAMERFCGDEGLYEEFLQAFLADPTMDDLIRAVENEDWHAAFNSAHALKGLAGNMGFVPLFHISGELIIKLRTGKPAEIKALLDETKICYNNVLTAIGEFESVKKNEE